MVARLELGGITLDVVQKDIKHVHLSVYPPTGQVRISAPLRMSANTLRVFAINKLGWIRQQQTKLRVQERQSPREYIDRESHYLWGERYLLRIIEKDAGPTVTLKHRTLLLQVRPGTDTAQRQDIMEEWYRQRLREALPPVISKWEMLLDVKTNYVFVQRMKTKWGGCNPGLRNIRLNSELAKKPKACLEYIVLHEMAHLLEPTHNKHFMTLMDHFMPKWQLHRDALNRLPVRHEEWAY